MTKFLVRLASLCLVLFAGLALTLYQTTRGPLRDYAIDFTLPQGGAWTDLGPLEVGAAKREVTPDLNQVDPWVDVNEDGAFDPAIDRYDDQNGNGTFDFVWLAGFGQQRPAQGVHDPLWARALAFRNNGVTLVVVSIDSIGLTHDRYLAIRERLRRVLPESSHVSFAATHTHNAPDTIGLWSYGVLMDNRLDESYIELIQDRSYEVVLEAIEDLRPARTLLGQARVPKENFSHDARPPEVVDHALPVAWFQDARSGETIATLASWGMHPEGFGETFPLISSDYIHYFREAMEKGLPGPGGFAGFGGTAVFFTGPVGGLMTQIGIEIEDRAGNAQGESGKSKAQGENLAALAANALRGDSGAPARVMRDQRLAVTAQTIQLPLGWPLILAVSLGIVHPGVYGLPFETLVRSEINAFRIGEIEVLTSPGEIYPEIIDGGVVNPPNADLAIDPVEVPPLRSLMRGKINMNFNLAMDEVGYLIPKSQWDRKAPHAYHYTEEDPPYGEIYVGTPEATPLVHAHSIQLLERLHEKLGEPTGENTGARGE